MIASSRPRRPTVGDATTQLNLAPIALSPAQAARRYSRVVVFEGVVPEHARDAILLGAGVTGSEALMSAITAAAAAQVAVIVVREPLDLDAATRTALDTADIALLGAPADTDWLRLASYLTEEPTVAPYGIDDAGNSATSDLFDLANSVAAVIGGPVTIENGAQRILAFSADQARGDEARKQSVLGHQVPQSYAELLVRTGIIRQIENSALPVQIPSIAPGVLPRVAIRIRAGGENLGSIWAIAERELTEMQTGALVEAAAVASITLFRQRASTDAARRIRTSEVLDLLSGGARAKEAAERLGYGTADTTVFAVSYVSPAASPNDEPASLQRLADAVGLYLHQVHPLSVATPVGGTVYAVLPHVGGGSPGEFARQIATTFAERFRHGRPVVIGIGGPVSDVTALQTARMAGDRAVRVLTHTYRDGSSRRVATSDEVRIEAILLRLADELATERERVGGPLSLLHEHDQTHDTGYIATLAAWLDAFGDVTRAAETLHLHANTFRYRLRRIAEIGRVNLADPEERFGLMLQLRLYAEELGHRPSA